MRFDSFQRAVIFSGFLACVAVISAPGCGPVALTRCVPGTCNGCCDGSGNCVAGTIASECGSNGIACKRCDGLAICQQGNCVTSGTGGSGGSGGTGGTGGSGGSGGSGGGATGGGSGGATGGGTGGATGGGAGGATGGSGGSAGGGTGGTGGTGGSGGSGGGSAGGGSGGGSAQLDGGYTSQLWFQGDFATDNVNQLGRELRPSGAKQTLTLPGMRVNAFAVRPDGKKLAVTVDVVAPNQTDLYLANLDGSMPTLLASAPAGGSLRDPTWSPDGTKLAFVQQDSVGLQDLMLVAATGGTPVQVSPTRSGTSSALRPISWAFSRDSSRIAVVGDFNFDRVNELAIATLGATVTFSAVVSAGEAGAAPVGTATAGAQGGLAWTATGKLLFKARLANDGSCGAAICFRLYQVDGNGTNRQYHQNSPLAASQIGAFGVSEDGTRLAYSSDAMVPTAYEVFVVPVGGSASPVRITSGTLAAGRGAAFQEPLQFSPDGTKVAFNGNLALGGALFETYVARADGVGGEVQVLKLCTAVDCGLAATALHWSPDSSQLAVRGELSVPNLFELVRLGSATLANQTPVVVSRPVLNGDLNNSEWTK